MSSGILMYDSIWYNTPGTCRGDSECFGKKLKSQTTQEIKSHSGVHLMYSGQVNIHFGS